jgi:hypothetical protein
MFKGEPDQKVYVLSDDADKLSTLSLEYTYKTKTYPKPFYSK